MTEQDMIRLLESRHDIQAVADPSELTNNPAYTPALEASRDTLTDVRVNLVEKVSLNARDLSETDAERARVERQLNGAVEHYRYYRGQTENDLLNPPPGQQLSPEEANRRQRLYERYYKMSPSDLDRQAFETQVEVLETLLAAYQSETELRNLGHLPHLEAAFRPAINAIAEYHREIHEDLIATEALKQARKRFDLAHRAHIALVNALLIRFQREDDARHFIKRREPTYRARRRAKASVSQEPEADSIQAEIDNPVPA